MSDTSTDTCRHCSAPVATMPSYGLWFHTDRPARGSTWCSRNPDLANADAETIAAPANPRRTGRPR